MLGMSQSFSIKFSTHFGHLGVYETEYVSNGSFETAGGGGADVFASWVEDTNGGSVTFTQDTPSQAPSGTYVCKMLSADSATLTAQGTDGNISQDITVDGGEQYQLIFYAATSADFSSMQGRYAIYDNDNSQWIVPRVGSHAFSSTQYQRVSDYFYVPKSCTSIKLYLYQNINSDSSAFFDSVSIKKRVPIVHTLVPEWQESGGISSYNHSSSVNLGYDAMSVSTFGDMVFVSDWAENGLGRSVTVSAGASGTIWEGFVNEIVISLGEVSITIGPLMDMANRSRIIYKTINWNTTPPVGGDTVRTMFKDNKNSQEKYGVLEGVITGGEGDASDMDQLIQVILANSSWPDISQSLSFGAGGGDIQLTINCLGYGHMMNKYFYYQVQDGGTQTVEAKMRAVLLADPNGIFNDSPFDMETNAQTVHAYEDDDKTALEIMKDIATLGDSSYNRFVFGVFANRSFRYWNVTERDTRYFKNFSDGSISDAGGGNVEPWSVLPGEWMQLVDLSPGLTITTKDKVRDHRFVFIESLSYTAPYQLSITGGIASKFRQRIDRLGLGGI